MLAQVLSEALANYATTAIILQTYALRVDNLRKRLATIPTPYKEGLVLLN